MGFVEVKAHFTHISSPLSADRNGHFNFDISLVGSTDVSEHFHEHSIGAVALAAASPLLVALITSFLKLKNESRLVMFFQK